MKSGSFIYKLAGGFAVVSVMAGILAIGLTGSSEPELASVAASDNGSDVEPSTKSSVDSQSIRSSSEVPGFGNDHESGGRDTGLAYYEAYLREVEVRKCMGEAGFDYVEDVLFPDQAVVSIAAALGLSDAQDESDARAKAEEDSLPESGHVHDHGLSASDPSKLNASIRNSLPPTEFENYHQQLYGESAADISVADRTESPPPGKDSTFATGGCLGYANDRVGDIWELRREFESHYAADREDSKTKVAGLNACLRELGIDLEVGASLSEVETAFVDGLISERQYDETFAKCGPAWSSTTGRSLETARLEWLNEHDSRVKDSILHYDALRAEGVGDDQFRSYLAADASRVVE